MNKENLPSYQTFHARFYFELVLNATVNFMDIVEVFEEWQIILFIILNVFAYSKHVNFTFQDSDQAHTLKLK